MERNVRDIVKLRNRTRVFRDRMHAGLVLAELLKDLGKTPLTILAIPAGGVPVAVVIAKELAAPLGVAVVSKITPPKNTEIGYGAVAFDGTVRLNEWLIPILRLDKQQIEAGIDETKRKVARRMKRFGAGRLLSALAGQTAVLVDDGLASGFTMSVATIALRKAKPARIVIAVPTGHGPTIQRLTETADEIYCPNIRTGPGFAVADAYQHWTDVTEEQAAEMLDRFGSSE